MNIKGLTEGKDYTRTENERYTRYKYRHTPKGDVQEAVQFNEKTDKGETIEIKLFPCDVPEAWGKTYKKYVACVVDVIKVDDKDKAMTGTIHDYNPQVTWFENAVFDGFQVDTRWALEDTEENRLTLIEKVYELAFGKEK